MYAIRLGKYIQRQNILVDDRGWQSRIQGEIVCAPRMRFNEYSIVSAAKLSLDKKCYHRYHPVFSFQFFSQMTDLEPGNHTTHTQHTRSQKSTIDKKK